MIEQVFGFRSGDLFRFVIEDSDAAVRARGNHTGGEVLEKDLVINFRVLNFGKQLRIVDRNGQLATEDLKRILFDAAINPSREPRTKEHHPGEVFAGKDANRHRNFERPHLFLHRFQFRCLPHAVQLIENDGFPMSLQVSDNRVVPAQHQFQRSTFASWTRVMLGKGVMMRQQDEHAVGRDGSGDRLRETLEQIL